MSQSKILINAVLLGGAVGAGALLANQFSDSNSIKEEAKVALAECKTKAWPATQKDALPAHSENVWKSTMITVEKHRFLCVVLNSGKEKVFLQPDTEQ